MTACKQCGQPVSGDEIGLTRKLINRGLIRLDDIITHSYPVEKLEEAILMQMSDASIKVLIEP